MATFWCDRFLARRSLHGVIQAAVVSVGLCHLVASASAQGTPPWLTGINLAEGAFNPGQNRMGYNYAYPSDRDIDYFVERGFRVIRIPILQDRLIRLDTPDVETADWKEFTRIIGKIERSGAFALIDLHQFGSMNEGSVGRVAKATDTFVAFWKIVAERLAKRPNVIFGLMNEPHEQSATEWLGAANKAIAAIRKAGAKQLILVPGSYWDGAEAWTMNDNATVMLGVSDPDRNFAYEVHQYLDSDTSGTKPEVVPGSGSMRLKTFTEWLRQNQAKGFLGEFGFAQTPEALAEGSALLAYMDANKSVWRGWTYWAAGGWWGDYMFSVQPDKNGDKPQMKVLQRWR